MKALLVVLLLLPLLLQPVAAQRTGDNSLTLSFNKPVLALGESISITVNVQNEACKQHNHRVDVYVYDDIGHLEERYVCDPCYARMLPLTFTFIPLRACTYTVKLWVVRYALSRYSYLEDDKRFTVLKFTPLTLTQTMETNVFTSSCVQGADPSTVYAFMLLCFILVMVTPLWLMGRKG